MTALRDQPERDAIANDLDTTLVVEAAAGTGKTTALVQRVMSVLTTGKARLSELIAVTFTDKAAGELKLRLRSELEKARLSNAADRVKEGRLIKAIEELEVARIGTIHSLCADLLRERPVEARIDPLFKVAAGDEAARILDEAFEGWFQRVLRDPPEGVRRLLRRRPRGFEPVRPRQLLRDAAWKLIEHRDFAAPLRRDPFQRDGELDALVDPLRQLGALAKLGEHDDWLAKSFADIQRFIEELDHREAVVPRDHDGLEAGLRDLARARSWRWKGGRQFYAKNVLRSDVLLQRESGKAALDALLGRCDADLAACLHGELRPVIDEYERLKARDGRLDFFDLLIRVRDLLVEDAAVRVELQRRFRFVFVDEFQDTDPLQAELLILLSADDPDELHWRNVRPIPGKLFLVGDPKQSIYRFRRADVKLYEDVKRALEGRGAKTLYLSTSFRSTPDIQGLVNSTFSPRMQGGDGGTQAMYVALEPHRAPVAGRPSVVALSIPRPYGDFGKIVKFKVEESTPDVVAAFIDWLCNKSGWQISDPEKKDALIPVAPRHVCILFKRLQQFGGDVSRDYTRALEARRLPHVLVGGRSFHAREEVLAVRNALTAIEWPDDELSVFATLRGPLFAVGDDLLLAFKAKYFKLHPLRPFDGEEMTPQLREVVDALAVLKELHGPRNRRPIADTLGRLLEKTRAHAGIAIWNGGEQALANVLRVSDLARRFEASGAVSFRAFVDLLWEQAERGEQSEAPIVEEGSEGVRMMTVHRAKGLEFPVVILAEPTAPASSDYPSRWVDQQQGLWAEALAGCIPVELAEHRDEVLARDREEADRLAYVASTRARDLLVIPAIGDESPEIEGWTSVFHEALYPSYQEKRAPQPAPGCPPFGPDSVLDRGTAYGNPERSVAPGLHAPRVGSHHVVWWDPKALELDKVNEAGLRPQRFLEEDEGGVVSDASARAWREWDAARAAMLERGRRPTRTVKLASEAGLKQPSSSIVTMATGPRREGRPHGKRFGALVHAVLGEVALDATSAAVLAMARSQGRSIRADEAEILAAADAAVQALAHDLLRRALAAGADARRESPVQLALGPDEIVEGVIDLAFREVTPQGPHWTVVEFKTDAGPEQLPLLYEGQLGVYVRAVKEATGESASGVLLLV